MIGPNAALDGRLPSVRCRPSCGAELAGRRARRSGGFAAALLVGTRNRARRRHECRGAARRPRRAEVLDAAALRADAWEQEGRARHARAQSLEVLGRRGPDDRADIGQAAPADAVGAELVDERGDAIRQRTPAGELEVLEVGRARVRGADEDERAAAVEEGRERVTTEQRVRGDGVGAEGVVERLGVGLGGDADVATLSVEQHQQASSARGLDRARGRLDARRAGALEARELQLDGDRELAGGVDQCAALALDARRRVGCSVDLRPDPVGIRIQPEDDLRGTLRDRRSETVREAPWRFGLVQ
jgi:hypothetical protein